MSRLSRLCLTLALVLLSPGAFAQYPSVPSSVQPATKTLKQDLDQIGRGLADDRTDMYQRYVYDDAQTVDTHVSLALPVLPNQDVQEWVREIVPQIMTVSPTLYPTHIKTIPRYFTQAGWQQLQGQWNQAGIPQLMQNDYHMNAVVTEVPQIIAKGRRDNVYRWIVDVPVLLTYTDVGQKAQSYALNLRIGITRIPMLPDSRLIAIESWGIAPAKAKPAETPDQTPQ